MAGHQCAAARSGGIARLSQPQDTLNEPIEKLIALQGTNSSGDLDMARASRRNLAQGLTALNAAAGLLSDQLTSQHFSHVDFDLRAVSA